MMMKVLSGLIGILNNVNIRQFFFLATSVLSLLLTEFKGQFGITARKPQEHHDLTPSAVRKNMRLSTKSWLPYLVMGILLLQKVKNFLTSWYIYVPREIVPQILNVDEIGQKIHEDYVAECINGEVSLWAPIKKQNNALLLAWSKKQTVKNCEQVIDVKETKELCRLGRLVVLGRSNQDIDHKNAVGNWVYSYSKGTVCPRWIHPSLY